MKGTHTAGHRLRTHQRATGLTAGTGPRLDSDDEPLRAGTAPDRRERLRRRKTGRKMTHCTSSPAASRCWRFVAQAPLPNVHRAMFGILALEAEPTDPRL